MLPSASHLFSIGCLESLAPVNYYPPEFTNRQKSTLQKGNANGKKLPIKIGSSGVAYCAGCGERGGQRISNRAGQKRNATRGI